MTSLTLPFPDPWTEFLEPLPSGYVSGETPQAAPLLFPLSPLPDCPSSSSSSSSSAGNTIECKSSLDPASVFLDPAVTLHEHGVRCDAVESSFRGPPTQLTCTCHPWFTYASLFENVPLLPTENAFNCNMYAHMEVRVDTSIGKIDAVYGKGLHNFGRFCYIGADTYGYVRIQFEPIRDRDGATPRLHALMCDPLTAALAGMALTYPMKAFARFNQRWFQLKTVRIGKGFSETIPFKRARDESVSTLLPSKREKEETSALVLSPASLSVYAWEHYKRNVTKLQTTFTRNPIGVLQDHIFMLKTLQAPPTIAEAVPPMIAYCQKLKGLLAHVENVMCESVLEIEKTRVSTSPHMHVFSRAVPVKKEL